MDPGPDRTDANLFPPCPKDGCIGRLSVKVSRGTKDPSNKGYHYEVVSTLVQLITFVNSRLTVRRARFENSLYTMEAGSTKEAGECDGPCHHEPSSQLWYCVPILKPSTFSFTPYCEYFGNFIISIYWSSSTPSTRYCLRLFSINFCIGLFQSCSTSNAANLRRWQMSWGVLQRPNNQSAKMQDMHARSVPEMLYPLSKGQPW